MKRSGFLRRKTPLKSSTRLKSAPGKAKPRKTRNTPKKLKAKLWGLCREIAHKIYPPHCYTCESKNLEGSNKQLGHFIASSICGAFLRFDLRNLRWQCMRCNMHAGGNGAEYYRRMVIEVGQEAVDQLFRDKEKSIKADVIFYENKIAEYETLLRSL